MIFSRKDLEVFNSENITKNDSSIRNARQYIKETLLNINDDINDKMNNIGLYHHKNKEHIVSLLIPCEFNHGVVNWIGIRYGKHPDVIDSLNFNASRDDIYGFQKHNCFQLDVCKEGFEIGMFHAVPRGSVDRMYCHQMINEGNQDFINELVDAINSIVGYGFVWKIGSDGLSMDGFVEDSFVFDSVEGNVGEEFVKWYSRVDCEGRYSSLLYCYGILDERVSSVEKLESEFFSVIDKLRRVYDVMCWK